MAASRRKNFKEIIVKTTAVTQFMFSWYCCRERLVRINPIQDGLFRGCSRMGGGQKGPVSLKSVTDILQ